MKARIKYLYFIYKVTSKIDGKIYIGKTTDPKTRWYNHQYYDSENVFKRALKKHSIENFTFEIIHEEFLTNKQSSKLEMFFIKQLNCKVPNGYNMTDGGEGSKGCKRSDSFKEKVRKANKGKTIDDYIKLKMSKTHQSNLLKIKQDQNDGLLFGMHTESY
jgi:group I intron endonuclease